jgi:DNA-binding transcriptional ArsR family regulator
MAKPQASAARLRAVLRVFALFGHPIRVVIFQRLAAEPMTAGEVAKSLPVTRTAVVQHLKRLETANLVDATNDGRRRVYRIKREGMAPLSEWVRRYAGDGK